MTNQGLFMTWLWSGDTWSRITGSRRLLVWTSVGGIRFYVECFSSYKGQWNKILGPSIRFSQILLTSFNRVGERTESELMKKGNLLNIQCKPVISSFLNPYTWCTFTHFSNEYGWEVGSTLRKYSKRFSFISVHSELLPT